MASFNKFDCFAEDIGKGVHNLDTDTLKVYLSNTAPDAAADTQKTDIAEITQTNGYDGPRDIANAYSQTSGVGTLTGTDVTWTASGGAFGPARYCILYNDDATNDELIGWWDYGSSQSPSDPEYWTTDFGASILTLT